MSTDYDFWGKEEAAQKAENGAVSASAPSLAVNIKALLAGGTPKPPAPTVCVRQDGVGLFYGGHMNVVFGDPESGKSWLAYCAVVEALDSGDRAAIVDTDHNGASEILARLLHLGASQEVLQDPGRFRLYEPHDKATLLGVGSELAAWLTVPNVPQPGVQVQGTSRRTCVVVIDSVGEIMSLLGKNSNDADDYSWALRRVAVPAVNAGACVILIDHLAKGAESRGKGPTGTFAKVRAVSGTSIRVTLKDMFVPSHGGSATLTVAKDRHGGLRNTTVRVKGGESSAGVFTLSPDGGWSISAPDAGGALSTSEIQGIEVTDEDLGAVDALVGSGAKPTVRAVKGALKVGTDKASAVTKAWNQRSSYPDTPPPEQGTTPTPMVCVVCGEPPDGSGLGERHMCITCELAETRALGLIPPG